MASILKYPFNEAIQEKDSLIVLIGFVETCAVGGSYISRCLFYIQYFLLNLVQT